MTVIKTTVDYGPEKIEIICDCCGMRYPYGDTIMMDAFFFGRGFSTGLNLTFCSESCMYIRLRRDWIASREVRKPENIFCFKERLERWRHPKR
jgi:hypothetical protein